MRARVAVLLATVLAVPMVLGALPLRQPALESHAATNELGLRLEALLARVRAAESQEAPALAAGVVVHWLAGAHGFSTTANAQPQAVDLDGDGAPELRVLAEAGQWPRVVFQGLEPAVEPWVAWVEAGESRWGLSGQGASPDAVTLRFRGGSLETGVAGGAGAGWHAAFALTAQAKRSVAWLSEAEGPDGFAFDVGAGWRARVDASTGGLRFILLDDGRAHDITLRGLPSQAILAQPAAGGLQYLGAAMGGALAYAGDASPIGQPGALEFAAEPLPANMSLGPAPDGLAVAAGTPTDMVLDWRPPGDGGIRVVGNDVAELRVGPGANGGLVLRGEGRVAVQRPGGVDGVVDLTAAGLAAGTPSPLVPAAAALALAGVVIWAMVPTMRARKGQRQVE
jgi:hypothetical protein